MDMEAAEILDGIEIDDRDFVQLADSADQALAAATAALAILIGESAEPAIDGIIAARAVWVAASWDLLQWDGDGLPHLCRLHPAEVEALVRWTYTDLASHHVQVLQEMRRA